MKSNRQGQVVTFYSFKGGTGRTMALANVAWILAANGKRVLVVDWDLESPGLDRFFHPFIDPAKLASAGGVVRMIRDYEWQTTASQPDNDWYKRLTQVKEKAIPLRWENFPEGGGIDILTTGRQNLDYHQNVATLNWDEFYERLGGGLFFDALRENMKDQYDYALIDSRTGFSDVASICTTHLPDILVDCFTFTDQGIDGSSRVARSVRDRYGVQRNIRILPVPMRVEPFETNKVVAGRRYAMRRFAGLPTGLDVEQRNAYWSNVQVPYVPYYAYEETLAVFGPDTSSQILSAYEHLTSYITDGEVTKLPLISETAKARARRAFERQLRPAVRAVRLHFTAQDELWGEWIEQVLLSAGVDVHTEDSDRPTADGEKPANMLVLSRASAPLYEQLVTDETLAISVAPIAMPSLWPENTMSVNGLREPEAVDEILRLIGHTDAQLPQTFDVRFPGDAAKIFAVPVRNPQFTGRDDELARLRAELRRRDPRGARLGPIVLHGMSGVGKTQNALEYAHRYGNAYDIVYWIGAADATESATFIDQKLNELARDLGIPTQTTITDTIRVVLAALSRGEPHPRWLLIYDNSNDPERDKEFLPHGKGDIIITSNTAGWERYARPVQVEVFSREESRAHLRQRVPSMTDADAERIAQSLEDLPLAISSAGALLADGSLTVDDYLSKLRVDDAVSSTFLLTFERLRERSSAAFRLLQLCSVLAPYIGLDFIYSDPFARALLRYDPSVASREDRERLVRHLNQLALIKIDPKEIPADPTTGTGRGVGLISESRINPTGGYIHMHTIVARVARQTMTERELVDTQREAHQILVESRPVLEVDDPESWRGYKALWPHQEASGALDSVEPAVRQLLLDRIRYIYLHGGFDQGNLLAAEVAERWQRTLDGLTDDAERRAMRTDLLRMRFNHANILRALGRYLQAYELDRRVLAEQTELLGATHPHTLRTLNSLGGDLRALGRYNEALAQDERLYESWKQIGPESRTQTVQALANLAVSHRMMGHFQVALDLDREVYQLRRRVLTETHTRTLDTRGAIGRDLRELGHFRQSVDELEAVVEVLEDRYGSDARGTLLARANHAVSLRTAGRPHEAERVLNSVYQLVQEGLGTDSADGLACRLSRGLTLLALGRPDAAREDMIAVEAAYQRLLGDDHPHTLICGSNLAAIAYATGDLTTAAERAETAVTRLARALYPDHPYTLAAATNHAILTAERGDRESAITQARRVVDRLGDVLGERHPDTIRCAANITLMQTAARIEPDVDAATHERLLVGAFGADHPAVKAFTERRYLYRTIDPHPF